MSEGVLYDIDGSTCGSAGCLVMPDTPSLPSDHCSTRAEFRYEPSNFQNNDRLDIQSSLIQ